MHEHTKCEHELKFCKDCDVVYCEKCKEEWKKTSNSFTWGGGSGTMPIGTPNFYVGDPMNSVTLCSSNCHKN